MDKELKIIEEVINDYKYELNRIYKEKEIKTKELNKELKIKKNKGNKLLEKNMILKIKLN